ncbi:hypothetical protein MMC26_000913 [Xylographa opegraphella]|nr:hypothetical protein [Xylographa opegraphella]
MANEDHLAYGDLAEGDESKGASGSASAKTSTKPGGKFSSFLGKVQQTAHELGSELANVFSRGEDHSHIHVGANCADGMHKSIHRFDSFAGERDSNDVKWYVDGCGYMWAVSIALEQAKESIWILDWWLTPELYLRRPPDKNRQYRLDRMLQAAAQRGVKVNVIVYKEVSQALTRKYLSPILPGYLHSLLPRGTDLVTSAMSRLGIAATFASLEYAEAQNPLISPPLIVDSAHTKQALEALHPNISVFRHPDHLPDAQTLESSFLSSLKNLSLSAATMSKLPEDALKAVYGMNEDVVLYWAHHEKLCLIDGKIAFLGGLDLCYGRWDTNQHSIVDVHPENLEDIIWPGQDYNNARISDFTDVADAAWKNNSLNRTESSRMGWSDISIGLRGPAVEDLKAHFVERWNFIYKEKYDVGGDSRYSAIAVQQSTHGLMTHMKSGLHNLEAHAKHLRASGSSSSTNAIGAMNDRVTDRTQEAEAEAEAAPFGETTASGSHAGAACQVVRSCTNWSHGVDTEHSVANAYISIIRDSQHFIYIENQFFITATTSSQKPVLNKLGAAILERILRAAKAGEKYMIIVIIPAVPGFAGDLKDESSLGTRAIMDFQYKAINRGGHSIIESIEAAGYRANDFIRFYNLRNYDRINVSASMRKAENASGVKYEDARREHDDIMDPVGYRAQDGDLHPEEGITGHPYQKYQQVSDGLAPSRGLASGRWDSVSECYMLGGLDIRQVPWENGDYSEMDAFVSEELYIHSKVLIADDRMVICGSANLNDRSQLGDHDSEIALVIQDSESVDSMMNGQPWRATKFAATLRRQLFRKHVGLLAPQNMKQPDHNFETIAVPNVYDFGTKEDKAVMDPLSDQFLELWNGTAKQNSEAFGRIFHPVPHDSVRTWEQYDSFYERFFHNADDEATDKDGNKTPAKYRWGHVIADNFSPGEQGLKEMKDLLSTIKGTLVEMPLNFLIEEDIARQGLLLNAFTEPIYT